MFETTKENKRMFNSIQSILVLMALLAFSWVDITLQFLSRSRLDGVTMTGDLKADLEALKSDQKFNLSSIA